LLNIFLLRIRIRHSAFDYHFSRLISSTLIVSLERYIITKMANPLLPQRATAMTRKRRAPIHRLEKARRVTKVRLTELSISSMHMKTTIALRRVKPDHPDGEEIPLNIKNKAGNSWNDHIALSLCSLLT